MRLIDADALIEWIDVGHLRHPTELCFSEMDVVNMINHQPTIEPQPERKHGKWVFVRGEEAGNALYMCSECGKGDIHAPEVRVPYCWHCGAQMGEEA